MNPPRVFISYSHDSAEHKKWVLDFATTLRNRGADAVLDQWDLKPGDDLPHFMETQLSISDYIIMICTEKYVDKANAGEGGVGYEKMIITSTLLKKIDSNKIIPIIRQTGTAKRPTFLNSKLYIDFSKNDDVEYNLDELLRTLLNAPLYEKPSIGANPFKPLQDSRPSRVSDGIKELMINVYECYDKNPYEYVLFETIVNRSAMHHLSIDRYLDLAMSKGLLDWYIKPTSIKITRNGLDYLYNKGIIIE
jgi:hypothetical protein